MLFKLYFTILGKIVRILGVICMVLVLMLFIGCQRIKDESKVKDNTVKVNEELKYTLNDEKMMEAIRLGITIDEINFLTYIARRADEPISELISLKKTGRSISDIDKQFLDDSGEFEHQSENKGKGYFIPSDPKRGKSVTNFKISDFCNIGYGMTISQVNAILEGRRPNKYRHTNTVRDVDVYELVAGGEIWIVYNSQGAADSAFRVETMLYRDPKEQDKSVVLIRKLNTAESGMVFQEAK